MVEFSSGGRSSEEKPQYDLVPLEAIRYIVDRLAKGVKTHGRHNYRKGVEDEKFVQDRRNHGFEHWYCYVTATTTVDKHGNVDTPIDHLKAALANGAMLAYIEEERIRRKANDAP